MKKAASVVVTAALAVTMLAGCGGDSDYCKLVKTRQSTLDSYGKKRTDAAFATYAKVARSIAAESPSSVKQDWTKLADVTAGVLKAHQSVGIKLQEMTDSAKVADLSAAQLKQLNDAYDVFNGSTAQRKAVVKDVKSECDITLA